MGEKETIKDYLESITLQNCSPQIILEINFFFKSSVNLFIKATSNFIIVVTLFYNEKYMDFKRDHVLEGISLQLIKPQFGF